MALDALTNYPDTDLFIYCEDDQVYIKDALVEIDNMVKNHPDACFLNMEWTIVPEERDIMMKKRIWFGVFGVQWEQNSKWNSLWDL